MGAELTLEQRGFGHSNQDAQRFAGTNKADLGLTGINMGLTLKVQIAHKRLFSLQIFLPLTQIGTKGLTIFHNVE